MTNHFRDCKEVVWRLSGIAKNKFTTVAENKRKLNIRNSW